MEKATFKKSSNGPYLASKSLWQDTWEDSPTRKDQTKMSKEKKIKEIMNTASSLGTPSSSCARRTRTRRSPATRKRRRRTMLPSLRPRMSARKVTKTRRCEQAQEGDCQGKVP